MKIVLFDDYKPGLLKGDRVVDVSDLVPASPGRPADGQRAAEAMIRGFDANRSALEQALQQREGVPVAGVRLRAPTPRPSKLACMGANYREFTDKPGLPIMVFLKSPEAVLDPGGTIVLPTLEFPICHHEAELAVVIGRDARDVPEAQAMDHVFGYMNGVDVSCRGPWGGNLFIGKSFDTFAPLGPCITTKDEIADPHALQIRYWVDGQPRHDYNTSDISHPIPECHRLRQLHHDAPRRRCTVPGHQSPRDWANSGWRARGDGDRWLVTPDDAGQRPAETRLAQRSGSDPGHFCAGGGAAGKSQHLATPYRAQNAKEGRVEQPVPPLFKRLRLGAPRVRPRLRLPGSDRGNSAQPAGTDNGSVLRGRGPHPIVGAL